jgi:peptidoglycan-N-acetylglucosamine deacetylase
MRTRIFTLCLSMLIVMGSTAIALARFVPARATAPVAATSSAAPSSTSSAAPSASSQSAKDHGRVIYLTFDDGPDPQWTPQVMQVLGRYDAKATFFMLGQNAAAHPGLVDEVRRSGHAVANHSWNHPQLPRLAPADVRSQLDRTSTAIGGKDRCMRPPYGATNDSVESVVRDSGKRTVLWDVDTNDWKRPGASVIENRVVQGAKPGANVLMHDGGGERSQTVAALDGMLRRLTAQGYTFKALPYC